MCLPNILSPEFMFAFIFHCRSFPPCWPLAFLIMDLTIPQRRRPWKRRWKPDFVRIILNFLAIIPNRSVTQKKGILAGAEERGTHLS